MDDQGQLRLDRAEAQAARDRIVRIVQEGTTQPSPSGEAGILSSTVNPDVLRFGGANRYVVASAIADHYWGKHFWNEKNGQLGFPKFVFVASGLDFPDALSGGAAAAAWGGPLLLTKKDELPAPTRQSLSLLKPDVIVVLGGPASVSTAVEDQLREYVRSASNVTRFTGANRYEVSANLAKAMGWSDVAYVASGVNFPDGMTGGAVAGYEISPLLLTKATEVPAPVLNVLRTHVAPSRVYVLGGRNSVSDAVVEQLKREVTADVRRIEGANRYEVAERLARQHPTQGMATIASGTNWPDALAGSALAGVTGSKLLLVKPDQLTAATERAVVRHGLAVIDVLGGPLSVHESVLDELRALEVAVPVPR